MNLARIVVDHIAGVRYEALSAQTVDVIKKLVVDTLGVSIAASGLDEAHALADVVADWGGKQESTLWCFSRKVPAHNAALVNSTLARTLDLDDVHEAGGGHLAATFVPAALALAEHAQKPLSGRDLILAIALGADLSCRLRCALSDYSGWLAETFAPLGVAAMGGRLVGFDAARLADGLGIAYSQCSTNLQAHVDGASTIQLQQGFGAMAGVLAVLLAEKGFTGAKDIFEGTYGLYPLYGRNRYNAEAITDGLGKRFEIANDSIKLYPCNKQTHVPIFATIELVREHRIAPQDIERITVLTNSKALHVTGEGENKFRPKTAWDAKFSIPYTVATAAIRGEVFLGDFAEGAISNPEVLALARRVQVVVDPEFDKVRRTIAPNRIVITTKSGASHAKRVEFVKGHPENPLSWQECIDKFEQCARFGERRWSKARSPELLQRIGMLEELEDARTITELLK